MRTFEIVLILVNLVTLFLHFRPQSRSIWLWSTGINLAILIIHGLLEGLRYQMAFSYIYVIVLVVFIAIKRNWNADTKPRRVLKSITIGLSFLLLAFTSFIAYALPVFRLPKPTGTYAVGIQYLHLIDEDRTDPFVDGSNQKRELMVKVYYPATDDRSIPFSPYFHSPELVRLFAAFHGMPDFLFNQLNLVKTNSKEGLQLSEKEQSYPVILFSHGAGTTMETQTSQGEDLASHGYIVVAIDHSYVSSASIFPNRIVSAKEATTDFGADPAEIITQIMADDSSFVIDKLAEMNVGNVDSSFEGKLKLDEIGAIGHSVGGAVAYNLAINDPRVKAAINLDGVVYVMPKGNPADAAPFLMLANDRYHIQAMANGNSLWEKLEEMTEEDRTIALSIYGSADAYNEAYNKAQENVTGLTQVLKAYGNLYTIEGSDHMKFTDIGLFIAIPQLREMIGIGGKTDPARCLEITKALTLTFFDQHLKGKTTDSLASLMRRYPELKRVDLR